MSSQFTFEAIGTHWWIEIWDEVTDEELQTTKERLEFLSSQFNQAFSRFRADSDISILNRERVLTNPSDECRTLLLYGKELYLRSQGTFNLLTGHILEARGYDATYSFKASADVDALPVCNPLTDLTIGATEITLSCGNVDLGGYGKGWLIDKLKEDLLAHNIQYFLINGGGDMYATSLPDGAAVTIYLEHPTDEGKYLTETSILNQGFAASSPFKRQWVDNGTTYNHIVSVSDTPLLATFTKANTATEADAFATVCGFLSEADLVTLSQTEAMAFARFDPITNQLWQTTNFT